MSSSVSCGIRAGINIRHSGITTPGLSGWEDARDEEQAESRLESVACLEEEDGGCKHGQKRVQEHAQGQLQGSSLGLDLDQSGTRVDYIHTCNLAYD